MAKNIQSLQLLRNTSEFYATREEALAKLINITPPAGTQDGSPVLARYRGTDGKIYTLVGYYADASKISGTTSTDITNMTVFDFEGNAADIKELKDMIGSGVTTANTVTKQLQDLSGDTSTADSGDTSVEGAKRYADEKVRAAIDALDADSVADDNKIVNDVTQTDGKITATTKNVTAVKLAGLSATANTKIADTDTLGEALGKLQGQIDSMDKDADATDGQVVTTVAEEDGKVTETKVNVKDLQLGGYEKSASATGDIASTDTINDALSKLENKAAAITVANDDKSINVTPSTTGTNINVNIKSGEHVLAKDGNAGLYTNIAISAVTGTELSSLGSNVKEAYKLVGTDNTKLGEYIKIYKDSSLYSVYLGHVDDSITSLTDPTVIPGSGDTALCFIYLKTDGTYELVPVNVEEFLSESEFKDGLQVSNHEVSVKVDASSEKVTTGEGVTADVLTVSASGVKVANVQNAIDYTVSTLDATVTGGTTAGTVTNGHIQVVVAEVDGKLTGVTVTETNIADADDLAALSAKTVTEIASSNGSIIATKSQPTSDGTSKYDIITDASKIKMSGFTSTDALSGINATSSVTEAFKEVDKVITDNELIVSTALNNLEATKVDVITVNGKQSKEPASGDVVASVTINGADIKLDGYASGSSSAAVVSADTVNDAIGKLENQIKAAVDGGLQQVEAGSGITVSAVANNKQTISVKLKEDVTTTGSEWENPLKFDSNGGLYINYLDCGTY